MFSGADCCSFKSRLRGLFRGNLLLIYGEVLSVAQPFTFNQSLLSQQFVLKPITCLCPWHIQFLVIRVSSKSLYTAARAMSGVLRNGCTIFSIRE